MGYIQFARTGFGIKETYIGQKSPTFEASSYFRIRVIKMIKISVSLIEAQEDMGNHL